MLSRGIWVAVVASVLSIPQQRPDGAQAARLAWEALNAGRAQEASAAFADALKSRPTDAGLLLGAALAAHQLGQQEQARRLVLDALKYDATLGPAWMLLGEILYASGDLAGAVGTYEQALARAPADERVAAKLERWRAELTLQDRFSRKLGDHFTVLFEGPAEEDLAKRAVEMLEAAYWRIGSALFTYPTETITVTLFTRQQFRDITQSPGWAGGAYDGRIRVPVQGALSNLQAFERVLTHEFTHAVVRNLAPRGAPQWLNEGLAMYFEGTTVEPLRERLRAAESVPSLSTLEQPFTGLDSHAAALAYAQSLAAVTRLMDDAGAAAIVGILTEVGRGIAFEDAFQRHANMTYADFQRAVVEQGKE